MAASRTLMMKRLVNTWVAAAVVLVVSIGKTAAQDRSGEAAAQPKKILFLYSFGPSFQPWARWGREICKELVKQSRWPLDIQEHSVITARNDDDAAEAKFVEYLAALNAQRQPDLIVAFGAPAARFVQRHRADLYPTTPMLLAAVEVRRIDQSMLSEQDVVAAVRADYVVLFENILRLLPETKAIAIIIGNSPNERFWADEQQGTLGPLIANRVELIFYNERPFGEILKEAASLRPHSAIFYEQLAVDGAGVGYGDKEPLDRIYEVANAPIFSQDETYFNGKIVGGRCGRRPRVPERRLLPPSDCWEERRQVASMFVQSNFQYRNTIGGNFSVGTSARAACRRGAKSCFGSRRHGNVIRGNSR